MTQYQNRTSVTKQRSSSPVAEQRRDVAKSATLWNATTVDVLAAERRNVVAMGASPWNTYRHRMLSPNGTTGIGDAMFLVAPLGLLMHGAEPNHGLAPVATTCRPVGTESQGASQRLVA